MSDDKWENESGISRSKRPILSRLDIGDRPPVAAPEVIPTKQIGNTRVQGAVPQGTDDREPLGYDVPDGWTAQHGAPGGLGTAVLPISYGALAALLDFPADVQVVGTADLDYAAVEFHIQGPGLRGKVVPVFTRDESGFHFHHFDQVEE